jgi:hypothetical protein
MSGTTAITLTVSDGSATATRAFNVTVLSRLDTWRLQNFGTSVNAGSAADSADPDGDGLTNAQEYVAGTNPNDRNSVLKISQAAKNGNDMLVSFPSVSGKTYSVERSDTLQSGSWTTVQSGIPGNGGTVQVTDTGGAAQPRRFYRVIAE